MYRGIVCLLWSALAIAQAPIDAAMQEYHKARAEGNFSEAVAKREEARSLLDHVPVDAPQFGSWVQNVAGSDEGAGGRAIVEAALARTSASGESHPTRIMLLNTLADSWEQDRNLLKSLTFREKAAAAADAAPPAASPSPAPRGFTPVARSAVFSGRLGSFYSGPGLMQDNAYVYQRLAEAYRRLGRPEDAAAVFKKLRMRAKNDEATLAALYQQQGQLDEAAALYKKQAEQAAANPSAEPWQLASPLQALANLYRSEERYGDAAAALQQAIGRLNTSPRSEARGQVTSMRQNLAQILHQAGQDEAAEQVYQQVLAETQGDQSVLTSYANFLGETKRAAQAETLLNDYLANHQSLNPWEESNVLYTLANVASMSGAAKRAEEYQQAAMKRQQSQQAQSSEQILIAADLQKAQAAANGNNLDEAFTLALQAMNAAPRAADRDQIAWVVPSLASVLAMRKAPDKAEQLYQRLFGLPESWSPTDRLTVLENYARFLMQQQDRWTETPAAIERYRVALTAARGQGTGWLENVLKLTVEFERTHGSPRGALRAGQDLLALEESLSGTTSEPYLQTTQTVAEMYLSNGDTAREVQLRRQAVAIADLVIPAKEPQRGFIRMNLALALARQKQFDEAERIANEALVIGHQARPPQPNLFEPQLEEIKQMKAASQAPSPAGAPPAQTN